MIETNIYKFKKSQTSDNIADVINVNEPANWDVAEAELEKINTPTHSTLVKQEPVFSLGADVIKGQVPINAKGLSAVNLIKDGNMDNVASYSQYALASCSVANNVLSFVGNATLASPFQNSTGQVIGHKYYHRALVKSTSNLIKLGGDVSTPYTGSNTYELLSNVMIGTMTSMWYGVTDYRTSGWDTVYVKEHMLIDLTAMFGSTVADSLTKEQCDKMFAKWFDGLQGVNNVAVKSVGKNLFDGNKATLGYFITPLGVVGAWDATYDLSDYICIKPNTQYYKSGDGVRTVVFYDKNKIYVSGIETGGVFTTPNNVYYLRLNLYKGDGISKLGILQLEEGTVITDYEPYVESISPLPTMHSLPNGVKDEIVDGKFIKRVQEYALVASDIISTGSAVNVDTVNLAVFSGGSALTPVTAPNISGKFLISGYPEVARNPSYDLIENVGRSMIVGSGVTVALIVAKSTYATLAQAQTALAGTKIIYQLATPITEDLVTPLTVFENGTISVESDVETTMPELTFVYPTNKAGVVEELVDGVNQLAKLVNKLLAGV